MAQPLQERVLVYDRIDANRRTTVLLLAGFVLFTAAFFAAVGHDGKTLMMNHAILESLGYELDEVLGADYFVTFMAEADRRELASLYSDMAESRKPAVAVNRIAARSGRSFLVEWHIKPVFRDSGEIH